MNTYPFPFIYGAKTIVFPPEPQQKSRTLSPSCA